MSFFIILILPYIIGVTIFAVALMSLRVLPYALIFGLGIYLLSWWLG